MLSSLAASPSFQSIWPSRIFAKSLSVSRRSNLNSWAAPAPPRPFKNTGTPASKKPFLRQPVQQCSTRFQVWTKQNNHPSYVSKHWSRNCIVQIIWIFDNCLANGKLFLVSEGCFNTKPFKIHHKLNPEAMGGSGQEVRSSDPPQKGDPAHPSRTPQSSPWSPKDLEHLVHSE